MSEEKTDVYKTLSAVDVSAHVEKKNTGKVQLSYLSWVYAWAEVKKRYPDANYEIEKFNGLPYVYDENTGYMVYTKVTIGDKTHEMWLPCMDGRNETLLSKPRTVKTKYSEYTVDACTMFDVNKTIMRCLVKNLAMFGLGLNIYAGEDLPLTAPEETPEIKSLKDSVLDYINNGTLKEQWADKAKLYVDRNDKDGLKKVIDYCKRQPAT